MTIVLIALIVLFMLFCAVAAGTETAYTAASLPWMKERAEAGDPRAATALRYMAEPELYLVTALMNNNLWNVAMVTLAQLVISTCIVQTETFRSLVEALGGDMDTHWDELLNSIIMTSLCLVFAEVLPKAVARACANTWALRMAPVLRWSDRILRLLTPMAFIVAASRRIVHLFGADKPQEDRVSRDDLRILVQTMGEQGIVTEDIGGLLEETLEMNLRPVTAIMTRLAGIRSVPETATIGDLEAVAAESGFLLSAVWSGRIDNIVGFVDLHAVTAGMDSLPDAAARRLPIAPWIMRTPLYVPETLQLRSLWDAFAEHGTDRALVVNEFGAVVGLVTREDMVGAMTGSLENTRARQEHARYETVGDGEFECSGHMSIGRLELLLDCEIPESGFRTVAGLVMKLLGRVPEPGMTCGTGEYAITVLSMKGRDISRVRVRRLPEKKA